MSMTERQRELTEKEKETLRLVVQGYDAKSMARHLGLSVHTINERLRNARRKLAVSSSREAARMLREAEACAPEFLADMPLGDASAGTSVGHGEAPQGARGMPFRIAPIIGGTLVMSLIFATLALMSATQTPVATAGGPAAVPERPVATAIADTAVVQSARRWLKLVDDERWSESWAQTGESFRQVNTAETWASVSRDVRPPLGKVLSRSASSQESVPGGTTGLEIVKFRTSFANKPDTIETLALVREGSDWKVVGYLIG